MFQSERLGFVNAPILAVPMEEPDEEKATHPPVIDRHLSIDESSPLLDKQSTFPLPLSLLPKTNHGALQKAWTWYERQLDQAPLLTKSTTAAILVGLGDLAGQCIELHNHHNKSQLDVYRTVCFALMGFLLQAPLTHYYYLLLDSKLPPTLSPWTTTTLLKLAIDQLLWAPVFTVCIFVFLDTLQGKSWWDHLRHDFRTTLLANWKLWVPASFLNLAFCPPQLRVLYCNVIFFVWSICLSLLLNQ